MQGSVYIPKIVQLHHPSGELYESYRRFAEAHPEGSWFQSDAFFRFISLWPEAQPILLVALSEEALHDPGRRYSKVSDPGRQYSKTANPGQQYGKAIDPGEHPKQTTANLTPKNPSGNPITQEPNNPATHHTPPEEPENPQTPSAPQATSNLKSRIASSRDFASAQPQTSNLLGTLLAVVIQNPVPALINFFPLAGIYKRFTSRTVVYGGPLLAEGTRLEREMTLKTLLGALNDAAGKRSLFAQFRNFYDLAEHKPIFHKLGYRYHDRLNLLVDTPDTETVWKQMSGSRRRQVRKSLANGAELVYNPTPEQIDAYYDILKRLYRKKVRKPLPSRAFFHALSPHNGHYTVSGFQQPHHPKENSSQHTPPHTSTQASNNKHNQYKPAHRTSQETPQSPQTASDSPGAVPAKPKQQPASPFTPGNNEQHTDPSTTSQTKNNATGNTITPQSHDPATDQTPPGGTKNPHIPGGGNQDVGQAKSCSDGPSKNNPRSGQVQPQAETASPFTTILVQHNNRIIGGITCPFHPGRTMYEWYVCGLDHAYKSRDIHPSVLATWGALDYAARQGIQRFDFMGLGKPDEPYGVRDFKARFGGKWVNHGRFSRVNKRVGYAISELVYNLKRLMIR